jgi:hypothetical protein
MRIIDILRGMADEAERRTERIPLLMTPSEVQALDDWAFANRIRSRGEAIRRLIEAGLKADDKIPIRGKKPEPSGGDDAGEKSVPPSKPTRRPRSPKAAPLSKEAQLRALREQSAR